MEPSKYFYVKSYLNISFSIIVQLIIHYLKIVWNIWRPKVDKDISGQTALVTGGGNGLGKQICIQLAKKGCNVVIVDIDYNAAVVVAKEIHDSFKIKSKAYKLDVTDNEEVIKYSSQIEKEMGPIDILVNNAGLMPVSKIQEVEPAELDKVLDVNLKSHFWMTKAFIVGMKMRNKGHIVAICSVAGLVPIAHGSMYSSSKFALKGFMDSLNAELLIERSNVKTTTVFPSFISTSSKFEEYLNSINGFRLGPVLKPSHVAAKVVEGIMKDTEYIIIPKCLGLVINILQYIPSYVWLRPIYKKLNITRRKVYFEKSV